MHNEITLAYHQFIITSHTMWSMIFFFVTSTMNSFQLYKTELPIAWGDLQNRKCYLAYIKEPTTNMPLEILGGFAFTAQNQPNAYVFVHCHPVYLLRWSGVLFFLMHSSIFSRRNYNKYNEVEPGLNTKTHHEKQDLCAFSVTGTRPVQNSAAHLLRKAVWQDDRTRP